MKAPLPSLFLLACCTPPGPVGSPSPSGSSAPSTTVRVESGALLGVPGEDPSVEVFKGVPFAAPPLGALRFRPPQAPAAWSGVRKAAEFSASCVQALRRSLLPWTEEYMLRNDVSEDCLALNVWRPRAPAQRPLPVFVYVHGGAYDSGSGEVLIYDGEALARRGVIVVTINYRLGVFGFLAHPELSAESPESSSGNYGLLDQIAALHWVQRNIAAFGGDPGRVTVGGQSAGAGSVHLLTASPLARGSFRAAITQSGAWDRRRLLPTLQEAEIVGQRFAAAGGAVTAEELRALPAADLYAAYESSGVKFRPIVDGWVVPRQVATAYEKRQQIDVPLLVGLMADERSSRDGYDGTSLDSFRESARAQYGDRAGSVLALYPATSDAEAKEAQKRLWRDEGLAALRDWRLTHDGAGKSKSFGYLFERAIPWPEHPRYRAFHSGELPYVFDNLDKLQRPWQPLDRSLADAAASYWVNFIATANPNGDGLPEWPSSPEAVMHLGSTPVADAPLEAEKLELHRASFPPLPPGQ